MRVPSRWFLPRFVARPGATLPQVEGLRKNKPMIVVGSPGRLAELSELGQLRSHGTRMLARL